MPAMNEKLHVSFAGDHFLLTGSFRRQLEVIEQLEWVTTVSHTTLKDFFTANAFEVVADSAHYVSFKGQENVTLGFYCTDTDHLYTQLFATSCSDVFLTTWKERYGWDASNAYTS